MRKALLYAIICGLCMFLLSSCSKEESQRMLPPVSGGYDFVVIQENFNGVDLVVVGSGSRNIVGAFKTSLAGEPMEFIETREFLPVVMEDVRGNKYDIFGSVLEGPDRGQSLEAINSGMGFWFAFASRYPGLELHGTPTVDPDLTLKPSNGWLVASEYVAQGAGFDEITALDDPVFERYIVLKQDPSLESFLKDDDLVIVVKVGKEERVYPINILNWHEVINDEFGGLSLSITYCPLTGTSKVWRRDTRDGFPKFGVSGFVYNSNLLAFDRITNSFWTQLEGDCVFGERKGDELFIYPHVETTWSTWRSFHVSPLVMSEETGVDRNYREYPYGDYGTDHNSIAYPLAYDDDRLPRKERVFCIIVEDKAKVYRLSDF